MSTSVGLQTKSYYQNCLNNIGNATTHAEKLRGEQSIPILGQASIQLMNALRNTTQLVGLATKLGSAFVTDFFGFIPSALSYLKPVNINTVHAPALIEKLWQIIDSHRISLGLNRLNEKITKNDLKYCLKKFIGELSDINHGQQFGYATEEEFLDKFQGSLSVGKNALYFADLKLAKSTTVPRIHVQWAEFFTAKVFQVIGATTVLSYLREWDLINTAAWAAKIGSVRGFGWVAQLHFGTVFAGLLLTGFTLALVVAVKKIYAACKGDQSVGPKAKARAPYEATSALAEAVYFKRGLLTDLGVIKNNPLFNALSLMVAKGVGLFCTVEKPSIDCFDTPMVQVAHPELTLSGKIRNQMSKIFTPITRLPIVQATAKTVHHFVTEVLAILNDFLNFSKDGYDKLYKILLPTLSIIDRALRNAEVTTSALFQKCMTTFKWHRDLMYATKIVTVFPQWITKNPATKNYRWTTPFHVYNPVKKEFEFKFSMDGISKVLLGICAAFDTTKFIHTNEIYRFDKLVEWGNQLAQKQISVFGYTAQVKDIPILREVNGTFKNIFAALNSVLCIVVQAWQFVVNGDKTQLELKKVCEFISHIGKVAVCYMSYADTYLFDFWLLVVGSPSGLSYIISQRKLRQKIEHRALANAAAVAV